MIQLPGDSEDYHLLTKGIELAQYTPGNTIELGLRRGGGTKYIIDALAVYSHLKTHIAVDPYGNIEYEHKEGEVVRLDYTNEMYNDCMTNVFQYAKEKNIAFIFHKLTDTQFFKRYADGQPIYNNGEVIVNQYSFVHFDGPHSHLPLLTEINFFRDRCPDGATWCFDDVQGYYDHDAIEEHVLSLGFVLIEKTNRKALYQKRKFENKN